MAQNKGMPKKKSLFDWILFGMITLSAMFIGCIIGRAVDLTLNEDESANIYAAANEINNVLTSPFTAVTSMRNIRSYAVKGAALGGFIALICFAYTSTSKKRFHRKGEEHGSARWGTKKEKNIIQDKNDLYNNIIYADDIYMVLDRKKRDRKTSKTEKKKERKAKSNEKKNKKIIIQK